MTTAILVGALILMLFLSVLLTRWRLDRASKGVIGTFVERGAIGPGKALPADHLGMGRRGYSFLRDYRRIAFNGLLQGGAVGQTEDGKYYLTDEAYQGYMSRRLGQSNRSGILK